MPHFSLLSLNLEKNYYLKPTAESFFRMIFNQNFGNRRTNKTRIYL